MRNVQLIKQNACDTITRVARAVCSYSDMTYPIHARIGKYFIYRSTESAPARRAAVVATWCVSNRLDLTVTSSVHNDFMCFVSVSFVLLALAKRWCCGGDADSPSSGMQRLCARRLVLHQRCAPSSIINLQSNAFAFSVVNKILRLNGDKFHLPQMQEVIFKQNMLQLTRASFINSLISCQRVPAPNYFPSILLIRIIPCKHCNSLLCCLLFACLRSSAALSA